MKDCATQMAPVIEVTRKELLTRRSSILKDLGLTLEEFYWREEACELDGAEWDARDDLKTIAFLLGE